MHRSFGLWAALWALGLLMSPGAAALDRGPFDLAQVPDSRPTPAIRLRYAVIPTSTFNIVVPIALTQGLFAKRGLDVEVVTVDATPTGLAALVSGSVQFAFAGSNLPDAVAAGVPVTLVFANSNVALLELCTAESIRTPRDLVGKTIALHNRGSSPDIVFRLWLESRGLRDDQVTIRNLNAGLPAILAAVASGAAQAYALAPPRCFQDAARGFHRLVDLAATGPKIFGAGVAVTRAYLEANRDVVRRFVAALVEARRIFGARADIALSAIMEAEKISDRQAAENVWAFYQVHLADPPLVDEEAVRQIVRYSSNESTRMSGPALTARMYDNSLVNEALEAMRR